MYLELISVVTYFSYHRSDESWSVLPLYSVMVFVVTSSSSCIYMMFRARYLFRIWYWLPWLRSHLPIGRMRRGRYWMWIIVLCHPICGHILFLFLWFYSLLFYQRHIAVLSIVLYFVLRFVRRSRFPFKIVSRSLSKYSWPEFVHSHIFQSRSHRHIFCKMSREIPLLFLKVSTRDVDIVRLNMCA